MTPVCRQAAASRLTALGVATVVAEYDACGDSDQIDAIGFRNAAGEDCTEVPDAVESQVEDLLYDLLGVRHGGWENNDGAFGTFCWNLTDQTLDHEHNERYTDTRFPRTRVSMT